MSRFGGAQQLQPEALRAAVWGGGGRENKLRYKKVFKIVMFCKAKQEDIPLCSV